MADIFFFFFQSAKFIESETLARDGEKITKMPPISVTSTQKHGKAEGPKPQKSQPKAKTKLTEMLCL